jgi:hypothetical protein
MADDLLLGFLLVVVGLLTFAFTISFLTSL